MDYVEYIGYGASFFVLLSFVMKKMTTLRIVNIFGCVFFIVYACLLPTISWPIIVTNSAIVFVNIFYLTRKTEDQQGLE